MDAVHPQNLSIGKAGMSHKGKTIGMLTAEVERDLFERHARGEARATRDLVDAHMPLINRIAGHYSRFGDRHDDFVQEGVAGFMNGLARFDASRGFRVNTFCRWWIRAGIADWARDNASMVRIGASVEQKRLYASLKGALSRHGNRDGTEPRRETLAAIACELGVSVAQVEAMRARIGGGGIVSLDAAFAEGGASLLDVLADDPDVIERRHEEIDDQRRSAALREQIEKLDPRKQDIIRRRYLADEAETLKDLSETHGVSRERIRQLEEQAIEELGLSLPAALSTMAGQERRTAVRVG